MCPFHHLIDRSGSQHKCFDHFQDTISGKNMNQMSKMHNIGALMRLVPPPHGSRPASCVVSLPLATACFVP